MAVLMGWMGMDTLIHSTSSCPFFLESFGGQPCGFFSGPGAISFAHSEVGKVLLMCDENYMQQSKEVWPEQVQGDNHLP